MAGFGVTTCRITPVYSGRLRVTFQGEWTNSTSSTNIAMDIRYGTGAGPANNSAVTGTQATLVGTQAITTGNFREMFSRSALITGLTPGVAVWLDISRFASSNTVIMSNVECMAEEF